MRNTQPRAHVHGAAPIPTSADLSSDLEKTSDDELEQEEEDATDAAPPLSRKEKRRLKKHPPPTTATSTTPPDPEPTPPKPPPNNPPKPPKAHPPPTPALALPMAPKKYFPLLVCSLGNPGPTYASTLHSTGHTILSTIQSRALYQPFTKGLSGLISRPNTQRYRPTLIHGYIRDGHNTPGSGGTDDITLWQSTSYMNVSGVSVKRAWAAFREEKRKEGLEARLVVVHDELESEMGRVGVKEGGASARGHNGLKSVQGALGQGEKWWRVGVGIGRPESREAEVVSRYVLRKMSAREGDRMERAAAEVLRVLGDVYDGTRN